MTTLARLKARILGVLQKESADMMQDGIDLVLDGINQVHNDVQNRFDFESSKLVGDYIVKADRTTTTKSLGLKKVLSAKYGVSPLDFITATHWATYPSDCVRLVQSGTQLFLSPVQTSDITLTLEVVKKFPDYADLLDTTTDWLLEQGADYLAWATICNLNHMVKEFVFRQEGNVMPPEKYRDAALETLLAYDSNLVITGTTATDLD